MILIVPLTFTRMPKPSKKAKANKPAAETTTAEPAGDPEAAIPLEDNFEVQLDDPTPMDHEDVAAPGGDNMETMAEPTSRKRAHVAARHGRRAADVPADVKVSRKATLQFLVTSQRRYRF